MNILGDITTIAQKSADLTNVAMNGDENPVLDTAVDAWLSTSMSSPGAHWAYMITTGLETGFAKFGRPLSSSIQVIGAITGELAQMFATMAEIQQYLQDPNIDGIPIASPNVKRTREVEVSNHAIIVQSKNNMEYRTDNATPKPRRWQVEGYLRTTLVSDHLFVIKPSLQLQEQMLDAYAASRKPVWFKDDYNQFYKVQIVNINSEHDAASSTTVKVSITLQEYKPFIVNNKIGDIWDMPEKLSDAGAA